MATWTAATRQASNLTRLSIPRSIQASSLIQRRGLASGGDHHEPQKVNFWEDPMSPSKWKEEHFVIVSLTGWGLLLFGGYKLFSKKEKEEEKVEGAHYVARVSTLWNKMVSFGHHSLDSRSDADYDIFEMLTSCR